MPIPLEPEPAADGGGQILMVTGANPAFGTQEISKRSDQSTYTVDVISDVSDKSQLSGRLFLQLNGTCCNLDVDSGAARFLQIAETSSIVDSSTNGASRYTIDFRQPVQPCNQGISATIVYVVPVVASGGFKDGPRGVSPDGVGLVDRNHYWTVICP